MSKIATLARNDIPERQNSEKLLKLLRARSQTYHSARRFQIAQLVATVALPIIGALASLWLPDLRAAFAGAGLGREPITVGTVWAVGRWFSEWSTEDGAV